MAKPQKPVESENIIAVIIESMGDVMELVFTLLD